MANVKIQELSVSGCDNCAAVREVLEEEIQPEFPEVELEFIDMLSDQGQQIAGEHGIMSSPGIIVNGELFAVGGVDKNKLIDKIRQLS